MEFIDSHGSPFTLDQKQLFTFLASNLGQQLKEDIDKGNKIDFSSVNRLGLQGTNILRLLNNSQDPSRLTLTTEVVPEEIDLLETANILGLQDPYCARHLAYRLWPVVQKNNINPLNLSEWQKAGIRAIARNYIPCPALMLEYLKENENAPQVKNGIRYLLGNGTINLSYNHCKSYIDYTYKFGTLEGLEDLVRYLCKKTYVDYLYELVLNGHMLDTFSLQAIQRMKYKEFMSPLRTGFSRIFLRNNYLSELSEHQLDTPYLPTDFLDLSGNPISNVTDEVFSAINNQRARCRIRYDFTLSLANTQLSSKQKKEFQKKFYNATHTIPERYTIIKNRIAVYKYLLAVAPFMGLLKDPYFFEEPNLVRTAVMSLVFVWWWYLLVNRFDVRLAQISHPLIGQSWGFNDFHDRSWVIWPKNKAKLITEQL
ncbi:MAG: hypothetical protein AMXMBFR12_02780 [Candidatus Babeliales bacterium]